MTCQTRRLRRRSRSEKHANREGGKGKRKTRKPLIRARKAAKKSARVHGVAGLVTIPALGDLDGTVLFTDAEKLQPRRRAGRSRLPIH